MKLHLTEAKLRTMKGTGRQETYSDSAPNRVGGLCLVVSADGTRKYFNLFFRTGGKLRRSWLGEAGQFGMSLADARALAHRIKGEARTKNQPMTIEPFSTAPAPTPKPTGPTLAEIAKRYILKSEATKRVNTAKEATRIIDKYLVPALGKVPASRIKKAQIRSIIDRIEDGGAPQMAGQVLARAKALFRWALDVDLIEKNPCDGIKRPTPVKARQRILDGDEIRRVWNAAGELPDRTGLGFKLLLLTGLRKNEVFQATWDEIDFGEAVWTIPASRSKNGKALRVPLVDAAINTIECLRQGQPDGCRFLFPHPKQDKPFLSVDRRKAAVARLAGTEQPWVVHDLRRTVSDNLLKLGYPMPLVDRILNHVEQGVTAKHYSVYEFEAEKREALESMEPEVWQRHRFRFAGCERWPVTPLPTLHRPGLWLCPDVLRVFRKSPILVRATLTCPLPNFNIEFRVVREICWPIER